MVGRGSLARRTPNKVWSDGIHLVRPSADEDDHPMRWRVVAHRESPSSVLRRARTLDEAILLAIRSSKAVIKAHPDAKALFKVPTLPPASTLQQSQLPVSYRIEPPEPKLLLPKFAITHFNCIRANPVAQVWQCVTIPGERAPVGRRKANGGAPTQARFNHTKGECAVLVWKDPIRDEDGEVRVFSSWQEAEGFALDLYYETPEDERISWREDRPEVARTEFCDILFGPNLVGHSDKRPFSIWIPPYAPGLPGKPAYAAERRKRYAKAGRLTSGGEFMPHTAEERAALEFNRKLAAMDEDTSNYQLTDTIATFETIWGAEEHAINVIEPTIPRKLRL